MNMLKSIAFLYTNNKVAEREENNSIYSCIKKIKIKNLKINLTKEMKDLCSEN